MCVFSPSRQLLNRFAFGRSSERHLVLTDYCWYIVVLFYRVAALRLCQIELGLFLPFAFLRFSSLDEATVSTLYRVHGGTTRHRAGSLFYHSRLGQADISTDSYER